MLKCKRCGCRVGFLNSMCDKCAKNHQKYELLSQALEECIGTALAIRTGTGEFEKVDLDSRLLMVSGAEHCILKLKMMLEKL